MSHSYYVYIMTNKGNNVLYTGVTRDLVKRVFQHKKKQVAGFTSRYNVIKLIYFEQFVSSLEAITREKQLKNGSRKNKVALIEKINPGWQDLYPGIASSRRWRDSR